MRTPNASATRTTRVQPITRLGAVARRPRDTITRNAPRAKAITYPSTAGNTRNTTMGKGGEMSSGKGDESGSPNYPVVIGEDGVPRIGACAVDPLQSFKSTELQMWPIFGNKLSFARPHMRASTSSG